MHNYISISTLNDYIFCPYSIYLHNVYMETDEGLYHATPQTRGRVSHESVDTKKASNKRDTLMALPIYSSKFGLVGKIDIYKQSEKLLVERKYQLKQLFRGQIYQLWAQYFCLIEMGYSVEKLAFYEISSNKTIPIAIPTLQEETEFTQFIERFKNFDPSGNIEVNSNKCRHCIYCNLCDKTEEDNVY
ncbi:MAG: type V CRISPR-associated protein Cas4 [Paludibacteraceae bacterium]|nr:type V CRISPR-associated protein Cas4 [Paludibacteraceae bacterium]